MTEVICRADYDAETTASHHNPLSLPLRIRNEDELLAINDFADMRLRFSFDRLASLPALAGHASSMIMAA